MRLPLCMFFFFNDTATTEIYTLSLHDALPIYPAFLPRPEENGSVLYRHPGLYAHGGPDLERPALRVSPLQHGAPFARALSDRLAGKTRALAAHHGDELRRAGRHLSAAARGDRFPQGTRRQARRDPERAHPRHRLQRLRARPGRARDPALLLHGADRMGRTPAPRKKADARTRRRLAEGGRAEIRYVYRRALPGAVGLTA